MTKSMPALALLIAIGCKGRHTSSTGPSRETCLRVHAHACELMSAAGLLPPGDKYRRECVTGPGTELTVSNCMDETDAIVSCKLAATSFDTYNTCDPAGIGSTSRTYRIAR